MFQLLSANHHQALRNFQTRPDNGSLIRAETCCLHRCKFVQQIVVLDDYLVYTFILYCYTQRDGKHQFTRGVYLLHVDVCYKSPATRGNHSVRDQDCREGSPQPESCSTVSGHKSGWQLGVQKMSNSLDL
jgi:hypothetical protein